MLKCITNTSGKVLHYWHIDGITPHVIINCHNLRNNSKLSFIFSTNLNIVLDTKTSAASCFLSRFHDLLEQEMHTYVLKSSPTPQQRTTETHFVFYLKAQHWQGSTLVLTWVQKPQIVAFCRNCSSTLEKCSLAVRYF